MDKTPIYKESYLYAYEHGEDAQYIASRTANIKCKAAIEQAIADHYKDNHLNTMGAVWEVVRLFGYERTLYVLANTVQNMEHDARISSTNKEWAQTIPVVFENGKRDFSYLITCTHPGLLDMFVSEMRHEYLLSLPLKREDIKAEAQRILTEFQNAPEPNSPNGTHYMAQVSPDFLARAKTKDHDRLWDAAQKILTALAKIQ